MADAVRWGIELDPAALDRGGWDGIWEAHVLPLRAFLAVSTQWRVAGMGGVIGLDYAAAKVGLEMAGLELDPADWADLQLIEAGALGAMNKDTS